jgi:hypothetical protein
MNQVFSTTSLATTKETMSMKHTILIFAAAFFPIVTYAGEAAQSPDAVENELRACLMKIEKPSSCMESVLAKKILPGNAQLASVASQMDVLLQKWLDKESIYAVHQIRTKKSGDIYESRAYFIEDTSGALMTFNLAMLKRLGKWYVLKFNLSSTDEKVNAQLIGE